MSESDWLTTAKDITSLEEQAVLMSAQWYDMDPGSPVEIKQLAALTTQTHEQLRELSAALQQALQSNPTTKPISLAQEETTSPLAYAYQLTRELLQSREAGLEMMKAIESRDAHGYVEYYRAISLKEQAARDQAKRLEDTISKLQ